MNLSNRIFLKNWIHWEADQWEHRVKIIINQYYDNTDINSYFLSTILVTQWVGLPTFHLSLPILPLILGHRSGIFVSLERGTSIALLKRRFLSSRAISNIFTPTKKDSHQNFVILQSIWAYFSWLSHLFSIILLSLPSCISFFRFLQWYWSVFDTALKLFNNPWLQKTFSPLPCTFLKQSSLIKKCRSFCSECPRLWCKNDILQRADLPHHGVKVSANLPRLFITAS